jgi:hypothetical protein
LFPPPDFWLIKLPAFLALDAALYKVILYIAKRKKPKGVRELRFPYDPSFTPSLPLRYSSFKIKKEGLKGVSEAEPTVPFIVVKTI